ncbi:MAG TPA: radical SAM protein [Methylomusa anaerophila]|uniref:FeMo cofactor biosynthesis protein NifB n=1 Tax=Methylomusa anaerophila TaxID=1930071 RepID=A0A348AJ83_9FIRM|nr:radical SAM protein [Methylomusa anaerophila]BBB91131.1 FeMo cofactor biosynthesis protein NifB [Methylomusa anaerophila]HML89007.1 radical SAM protein [Methylomusa anaerophila]
MPDQACKHPCYSYGAHLKYARMHLPVAPQCNMRCNYCNTKFDCIHENRPGVTSQILSPAQARQKFALVKEKISNLSVVGVAGPGEPLANWEETRETIALIKEMDPEIIFCLSTNGLLLPDYADEILRLGVKYITVTVNAVDPEVGAQIHGLVRYQDQRLHGVEGATLLINNQLAGIARLVRAGVEIKVNTVMIKVVNDWHIPEIVKQLRAGGAGLINIIPHIPILGSVFYGLPQTTMKDVAAMREVCGGQQMTHCQLCRADAVGLIGEDRMSEFMDQTYDLEPPRPKATKRKRYKIAVTTQQGEFVDQHFDEAGELRIYIGDGIHFNLVDERKQDKHCLGAGASEGTRRAEMIKAVADCDAVLTMGIGYQTQKRLLKKGIMSVEYCHTVETGLGYTVEQLNLRKDRGNMKKGKTTA